MSYARQLTSATKRVTNVLALTPAESQLVASGWTAGANLVPSLGSTPGPYGFGLSTLLTASGAARTLTLAAGTFGHGGVRASVFVRGGSGTSFILAVQDTTNALVHYASFTITAGVMTLLGSSLGVTSARVNPAQYDNGWQRLEIEFIPGAYLGGATTNASNLSFYMQVNANPSTIETWGALLESNAASNWVNTTADGILKEFSVPAGVAAGSTSSSAVTDAADLLVCDDGVFLDQAASAAGGWELDVERQKVVFPAPPAAGHVIKTARRGVHAAPYMTGISSGLANDQSVLATVSPAYGGLQGLQNNEPAFFRPQRVKDESGVFYTEWLSTPLGDMLLQGRSDSTAPWFNIVTISQANLNGAGQYSALVALMPEMRVLWPTWGNATMTQTTWILE